jgi:NADH-quinone oxidoreductase subunit N
MAFQLRDVPRLLPELMLLLLALMVLITDVLERWGSTTEAKEERTRSSGSLAALGLGLTFVITLVQSRYLFTVPEPQTDDILSRLLSIVYNLQQAGPGEPPILGAFANDNLAVIARLTFTGAAFLATLLSLGYRTYDNPGEFYALILFSTAGMCIMAAATELILAFVALELSSIALYVLAGYFRDDKRSVEAGMKYFLFGTLSSAILLYGMSLAYGFTASANVSSGTGSPIGTLFSTIAEAGRATPDSTLLTMAMVFIIAGIGYKITVVPFHAWSPDVYEGAPTVMTAFISTASKTAGFILLFRLLTTAFPAAGGTVGLTSGWTSMLTFLALLTIVVGNLSALPQTNAKRLLAYSSIGHAGFLLMALLLWNSEAVGAETFSTQALLYYLIAYTLTNLGVFGGLAIIAHAVGGDNIDDLNGLSRRNLSLAVMLTILVLSLAGVPPLSGYWGKFFVFMTGYRAGAIWLVVVAVVMTVVSLYYYLRLLKAMWLNPPTDTTPIETPRPMNAALIISTVLVIVLGVVPNLVWNILGQASEIASR